MTSWAQLTIYGISCDVYLWFGQFSWTKSSYFSKNLDVWEIHEGKTSLLTDFATFNGRRTFLPVTFFCYQYFNIYLLALFPVPQVPHCIRLFFFFFKEKEVVFLFVVNNIMPKMLSIKLNLY